MFIEMLVEQVAKDPFLNSFTIILKEKEGEKFLPIWIGKEEALVILSELEDIQLSRPIIHDFIEHLFEQTSVKMEKVVISDFKEGFMSASIFFKDCNDEKTFKLEARPSDAIALALRTKVPIFVSEEIIKHSSMIDLEENALSYDGDNVSQSLCIEELDPNELKEYRKFIESITGEDFYKWKT